MCFQRFVYYACGHQELWNRDCELALDHPFYLRIQCPSYGSESARPSQRCGLGRYYCKLDHDADFLDSAHRAYDGAQTTLLHIDNRVANIKDTAAKLMEEAQDRDICFEKFQTTSTYKALFGTHLHLMQERARLENHSRSARAIITQAQQNYIGPCQYDQNGDGNVFAPLLGSQPSELQAQTSTGSQSIIKDGLAFHPADPTDGFRTFRQDAASQPSGLTVSLDTLARWTSRRDTNRVTTRRVNPLNHLEKVNHLRRELQANQDADVVQMMPPSLQRRGGRQCRDTTKGATTPDGRRRKPGAGQESGLLEDLDIVRRSARLRNKKISYVEDSSSDVVSRDPSPSKSEGSRFSPDKTEQSDSPAKTRKLRREGIEQRRSTISLVDRIGDWKRRGTFADQVAPSQPLAKSSIESFPQSTPCETEALYKHASPHLEVSERIPTHQPAVRQRALLVPQFAQDRVSAALLAQSSAHGNINVSLKHYDETVHESIVASNERCYPPTSQQRPDTHTSAPVATREWSVEMHHSSPSLPGLPKLCTPAVPQNAPMVMDQCSAQAPSSWTLTDNSAKTLKPRTDSSRCHVGQTLPSPEYERMRGSSGSTANMTPPNLLSDQYAVSVEPKKCCMPPTDSPVSRKRMRLSLPGESGVSSYGGKNSSLSSAKTSSMSSPRQAASKDLVEAATNVPLGTDIAEEMPIMPAPILAPPAVMYVPAEYESVDIRENGDAHGANLPTGQSEAEAGERPAPRFQFTDPNDFDWSFLNEEAVEEAVETAM